MALQTYSRTFTDACWVCWWRINIQKLFHTGCSSYSTIHKRVHYSLDVRCNSHIRGWENVGTENLQWEFKNGPFSRAVLLIWLLPSPHTHLPAVRPSLCGNISSCVMECTVTYISAHIYCTFFIDLLCVSLHAKKQNTTAYIWHQVSFSKRVSLWSLRIYSWEAKEQKQTKNEISQLASYGLDTTWCSAASERKNLEQILLYKKYLCIIF